MCSIYVNGYVEQINFDNFVGYTVTKTNHWKFLVKTVP